MNKPLEQFSIGAWFALAVGMGIMSKSWETFFSFVAIGCFFASGMWATRGRKSPRPAIRAVAVGINVFFFGVLVSGLVFVAERLYLVNGDTYPAWLATADLGTVSKQELLRSPGAKCVGKGGEFIQKSGGLVVFRCSGTLWYESHTYIAHVAGGLQ